jgi:endonuclease YncB( thermonuclease family)
LLFACERPVTITGAARVIDGDSLEIASTSIRLHAVDAPEGRQRCTRDGTSWDCGGAAANRLRELVAGRAIICDRTDTDSYGRTVARCRNGEVDLGAEMVLAGLALAYRQYGRDYVDHESRAKAANRGVWAGEFTPPWDWRQNPDAADTSSSRGANAGISPASDNCLIKGNINREGERIYHTPRSNNYQQTIIDERRGERWFCTEREAIDAGWRAPRG